MTPRRPKVRLAVRVAASPASRRALAQPLSAPARGRRAGFTLVELLVALAIMGLLAGLLGSGLGLARRIVAGGSAALAATDAVANTQMTIRERLLRLAPVPRDIAGGGTIEVTGSPTEFRWAGGNLTLLTASTLDRRVELGEATLAGWTPHVLLRDVAALDIAYFGLARQPGGSGGGIGAPGWQPTWVARNQPPELVRVRLVFAAQDRRRWPDLVVRPRTTISTACLVSVRTGRCERE
jgi:general secretion pathway protein J